MADQSPAQAAFVAHCEALIQTRVLELSPLEGGRHKIGRNKGSGWEDITGDRIYQIKREIAELESAISMYRDLSHYV